MLSFRNCFYFLCTSDGSREAIYRTASEEDAIRTERDLILTVPFTVKSVIESAVVTIPFGGRGEGGGRSENFDLTDGYVSFDALCLQIRRRRSGCVRFRRCLTRGRGELPSVVEFYANIISGFFRAGGLAGRMHLYPCESLSLPEREEKLQGANIYPRLRFFLFSLPGKSVVFSRRKCRGAAVLGGGRGGGRRYFQLTSAEDESLYGIMGGTPVRIRAELGQWLAWGC